jgi:hypothetical protein
MPALQQNIHMITITSIIGAWLTCTIASERAAEAITASVIFAPLRQFLARMALADPYGLSSIYKIIKFVCRWLSELVSCGWCTSLWTSLFFSFFLPGKYATLDAGGNLFVKAIALWGFANFWHAVFRLVHNGRVSAVDVNLNITESENIISYGGGTDGEFGEGISQEDASGNKPSEI